MLRGEGRVWLHSLLLREELPARREGGRGGERSGEERRGAERRGAELSREEHRVGESAVSAETPPAWTGSEKWPSLPRSSCRV